MGAQHTPGPWMFLPDGERGQFVILTKLGHRLDIAETYGWPSTPREANARLIAAAPDLLAAAQRALAHLNARIDAAVAAGGHAVPVFDGIV